VRPVSHKTAKLETIKIILRKTSVLIRNIMGIQKTYIIILNIIGLRMLLILLFIISTFLITLRNTINIIVIYISNNS